jgi:hypothetical protein
VGKGLQPGPTPSISGLSNPSRVYSKALSSADPEKVSSVLNEYNCL